VELDELLGRSDFVSLHTPLNSETRRLIGERELRLMKPTTYLINTSRGPVVDEGALIRALQEGWIAGAGLDVFEVEPLPVGSPLLELDNVILTPHSAGYSDVRPARMHTQAAQEIVRVLKGHWPQNLVNPEVKGRARLREG
jgi:phosphoglycerate dehydrogenase-like enzyme